MLLFKKTLLFKKSLLFSNALLLISLPFILLLLELKLLHAIAQEEEVGGVRDCLCDLVCLNEMSNLRRDGSGGRWETEIEARRGPRGGSIESAVAFNPIRLLSTPRRFPQVPVVSQLHFIFQLRTPLETRQNKSRQEKIHSKTNTMKFVFVTLKCLLPVIRPAKKTPTYLKRVVKEKWDEVNRLSKRRVRWILGGDKIDVEYDVGTNTAALPTVNALFHSIVSTHSHLATIDIVDYYFGAVIPVLDL